MPKTLIQQAACIADLKNLAEKRIPRFAYEYLSGGCNSNHVVNKNRQALNDLTLFPKYLKTCNSIDLSTGILGQKFAVPIGIAPIGLSGLIWPRASEYQARAAKKSNIPFVLSSLSSISIEQAAEFSGNNFWFQLYPPTIPEICTDLLTRAWDAGCRNLVVTIDVPSPGRRPCDMRNGLSVPPKISLQSILQTMVRPQWCAQTLLNGMPQFATMKPYIPPNADLKDVAHYIRNTLKKVVDLSTLEGIRQQWQGNLIVKGVLTKEDAQLAVSAGADALIISNHGGRQLDAATSSLTALSDIRQHLNSNVTLIVDGGVESGVDIARFIASGADLVLAGRAFMYGVGALGEKGAMHTIDLLTDELTQVLEQLRCATPADLPLHLK